MSYLRSKVVDVLSAAALLAGGVLLWTTITEPGKSVAYYVIATTMGLAYLRIVQTILRPLPPTCETTKRVKVPNFPYNELNPECQCSLCRPDLHPQISTFGRSVPITLQSPDLPGFEPAQPLAGSSEYWARFRQEQAIQVEEDWLASPNQEKFKELLRRIAALEARIRVLETPSNSGFSRSVVQSR